MCREKEEKGKEMEREKEEREKQITVTVGALLGIRNVIIFAAMVGPCLMNRDK